MPASGPIAAAASTASGTVDAPSASSLRSDEPGVERARLDIGIGEQARGGNRCWSSRRAPPVAASARRVGAAPRHGRGPRRSPWRASGRSRCRSRSRRRCRSRLARRSPAGSSSASTVPPVGRKPRRRILGVHARLDGVPARAEGRPVRAPAARLRRCAAAARRGRRPYTISVTGCSTCRRVFISMKKNSSGRSPETMNSTVPGARRSRTPARPRPRGCPSLPGARSVSSGEGASSTIFWWRRCRLHSRSPRCTTLP